MKKGIFSLAILFLGMAALFSLTAAEESATSAQKAYELKYQLKEGTKFVMTSTSSTESLLDQMGTEVVSNIEGEGTDTYTVLKADKASGLFIEVEMGERVQDISSDQGSASTDFSELVGKKAKFVLLPNGDCEGFEGFDLLPEVTTASGETISAEAYMLGVKGSFPALPEKSVKFGDTWTDSQTEDVPLGAGTLHSVSETTYTLIEEVEMDGFACLKIEFRDENKMTGEFEQMGTPLSIERDTTTTGFLYFAYEKGMYIRIESEAKADGIILVESAGIELPQTITTKGTVAVSFE